ncbi:MAG: cytochrome c biogenesis protein CcsA [Candidatus Kapabacteria bacterium]|nr:cytochrome c biogenesis protein CcsA [Ignavibacteriota bacterium]MCW5885581.1 cytochrome c biogenesis protein CcsA [Candidatus Kapabacteria bacterium]
MLGKVLIYMTVAFSGISVLAYLFSDKKGRDNLLKLGVFSYYAMTFTVVAACIYLLSNILAHNFQFTYIWEYSSTELHDYFLVASFYSGQQGSFMLWMLMLTIIGLVINYRTARYGYQSLSMGIFTSIIFFLAVILIFKSPFDYVWETFAAENLEVGFMPVNGRGLNPILQNYWITIHPPILFIGYSMMAVPYTYALTALIKRDYKGWIDKVMPWTLFGAGILGLGIMMGGYWAYETLGWGGFWAWDPVENSSLIPWMIAVGFIHTLLVQRRTNGLVKTNIALGLLTFIFVVYATFLTRSGILGDTSVHSFVTPGAIVYNMLILFQVIYLGLGIFYMATRWKDMTAYVGKKAISFASKEYSVSLGAIVFLALAAIVIMGTSWPAVAELFGQEKVAVDISNYDKFGSIFAVIFLILNGISLYQRWNSGNISDIFGKLIIPTGASVVLVAVFYFMGLDNLNFILLTFAAFFSLITNLEYLIRNVKSNPKSLGAYIAHIGLVFLILGAVISGVYSSTKQVRLKTNETKSAFGYDFTFVGYNQIETEFKDREKFKYNIKIEKNGSSGMASPIVYWSDFNEKQSPFLEPGVYTKLEKDIYLSPKAIEAESDLPRVALRKDDKATIPLDTNLMVSVKSFVMDKNAAFSGNSVVLNTVVSIEHIDGTIFSDTLNSLLDATSWEAQPSWKKIADSEVEIAMTKLIRDVDNIHNTRAVLSFKEAGKPEPALVDVFTFDVSVKPFINLVWLGTLAVTAGFFLALYKYPTKNKKNIAEE